MPGMAFTSFCTFPSPDLVRLVWSCPHSDFRGIRKSIKAWKATWELSSDLAHHHLCLDFLVKAPQGSPSLSPQPQPKRWKDRCHLGIETPRVILQRVILHWGHFCSRFTTLLFQRNCSRAMKWCWWSITIFMVHICFHFCFCHAFIHPTFTLGVCL